MLPLAAVFLLVMSVKNFRLPVALGDVSLDLPRPTTRLLGVAVTQHVCAAVMSAHATHHSLNSLVQRTVEPRDLDRCLSHSERAPSPRIHNTASLIMAARSASGGAGTILYDLSSQLGMSEPGFVFVCFGASYAVGYCAGRMNLRSR